MVFHCRFVSFNYGEILHLKSRSRHLVNPTIVKDLVISLERYFPYKHSRLTLRDLAADLTLTSHRQEAPLLGSDIVFRLSNRPPIRAYQKPFQAFQMQQIKTEAKLKSTRFRGLK